MKKHFNNILFIIIAMLLSFSNIYAQTAEEFFMLGNNAYKSGDYKNAIENYQSAIKSGFDGSEIRFNLANANAKIENNAQALLNYMKSFYESPRMRETVANLEIFASDNGLDSGLSIFSTPIITELSQSEWTIIAFLSFWSAIALIFLMPLFAKRNTATIFLSIICIVIFSISIFSIRDWQKFADAAISINNDIALRLSPTNTAPISSIIEAGQIASIENENGDFIYIKTSNDKKGWSNRKNFVQIKDK